MPDAVTVNNLDDLLLRAEPPVSIASFARQIDVIFHTIEPKGNAGMTFWGNLYDMLRALRIDDG